MIKGFIISVEDNPNDVALMKRVFDRELPEVEVVFMEDSLEALEWFKEHQGPKDLPDLILLDIKMPKLSGLSLLKEIRELDAFLQTPIAMLSSSDQLRDKEKAYEFGANSYLEKPKNYADLKERLPLIASYWLGINK